MVDLGDCSAGFADPTEPGATPIKCFVFLSRKVFVFASMDMREIAFYDIALHWIVLLCSALLCSALLGGGGQGS